CGGNPIAQMQRCVLVIGPIQATTQYGEFVSEDISLNHSLEVRDQEARIELIVQGVVDGHGLHHRAVDPRGVSVGDPSGLLGQTNGFTEIWIGPQSHRSHPHRSPVSVRPLPSELATGGFLPPGASEDTLENRGDTGPVTPMWFRLPFPGESQRQVLPGEATALE